MHVFVHTVCNIVQQSAAVRHIFMLVVVGFWVGEIVKRASRIQPNQTCNMQVETLATTQLLRLHCSYNPYKSRIMKQQFIPNYNRLVCCSFWGFGDLGKMNKYKSQV